MRPAKRTLLFYTFNALTVSFFLLLHNNKLRPFLVTKLQNTKLYGLIAHHHLQDLEHSKISKQHIQNHEKHKSIQDEKLSFKEQMQQWLIYPKVTDLCFKAASDSLSDTEIEELIQLSKLERAKIEQQIETNAANETLALRRWNKLHGTIKDISKGYGANFFSRKLYRETFKGKPITINNTIVQEPLDQEALCARFKRERKYITKPLSQEEAEYPIAYSIVIHKQVQTFERLLRAIYHPQNYYCVHVDEKSSDQFKEIVRDIISCFPNIVMAESVSIYYESYYRVVADINCMKALDKFDYKYLFNLCGQDFPIKTNLQLVRDCKKLNGTNELESMDAIQARKIGRVLDGYDLRPDKAYVGWQGVTHYMHRNEHKDRTEAELATVMGRDDHLFWVGSAYFLLSQPAVSHILRSEKIQRLFSFVKDSFTPDEWAIF